MRRLKTPAAFFTFFGWFRRGLFWKLGILILVVGGILLLWPAPETGISKGTTFTVRRGPLRISVSEGGTIEAAESQTSKSEIKGQTKILSIVEEGYQVTEEDVRQGKVLVTLDDSQLLEQKTQQEMQYQSALAQYTDSREQYEIQIKQNESDIKAAELEVKFARMDFEKYLGAQVAGEILARLQLDAPVVASLDLYSADSSSADPGSDAERTTAAAASELTSQPSQETSNPSDGTSAADSHSGDPVPAASPNEPNPSGSSPDSMTGGSGVERGGAALIEQVSSGPALSIDFSQYADADLLGDGEAQQRLKALQNARMLAQEELALAETNYEGTRRLSERNFVTQQELDADEMKVKRSRNSYESSVIEENLFIRYEFPKRAEQLLSNYQEALRKLERTLKLATSKLAQAAAKKTSAEATYQLQKNKRDDVLEQIEKCVIRAERPGLVVYAGSNQPWRMERIEEGASVREGQEIVTIPDMTQMTVNVKVHESSIKKIQKGQKATITLDAFPDEMLHGEVTKLSVLPDSSMRWMNPDIKLYPVIVTIQGVYDWLKPGLSAQTEIIIKELDNVLYVPIQAVSMVDGQRVCYVLNALGLSERRLVTTGDMSADFIEIQEGLEEGETVLLRAPALPEEEHDGPQHERPAPPQEPIAAQPAQAS